MGRQDAGKGRLMRGDFTQGEPIADRDALTGLAVDAGLQEGQVRAVLAGDGYADDAQAHAYGITGVPFFVLDDRYGISGAQPPQVLQRALATAWADHSPARVLAPAGGPDPDAVDEGSCAV